jgi:hypothetical protein
VYSWKSATSSPGGSLGSLRVRMKSRVFGDTSSAYTWSPSHSITCGHSLGSCSTIRNA